MTGPGVPIPGRAEALTRVRDLLASERDRAVEILTSIETHQSARYEVDAAIATLDGAAAEVGRHRPPRLDRSAVFMPSNVILYSYVLFALVPTLFIERTAFRPASQVRHCQAELHRWLSAAHRLPVEHRPLSQREFMGSDVAEADVVVFTGRYANATRVSEQLRPEQLLLFLGSGVNPFVVAADADVPTVVKDLVHIRLLNSGQDCLAPDAVFVHRSIARPFVDELVADLAGRRFGPNHDVTADYGPLFYQDAFAETVGFLARHREHVRHGGIVDLSTMRLDPVVLVRDLADRPSYPEVFAPVFNVVVYDDGGQLRNVLGGSHFTERALGASVYGNEPTVTGQLARRHTVTRNESLLAVDDGNQPFGGFGRLANFAGHGGVATPEPVLVSRAVARYLGGDR